MSCVGCFRAIIANLLVVFNILFLLVGGAILFAGIWYLIKLCDFEDAVDNKFLAGPILTIIVGVIIFVLSFIGCCAAQKRDKCLLKTYIGMMFVVLILEIVVAIVVFVQATNGNVETEVHDTLTNLMDNYSENEGVRETFDYLQKNLLCCGVENAEDYRESNSGILPKTCCFQDSGITKCSLDNEDDHYIDGCAYELYNFLLVISNVLGSVAIVVGVGLIACILSAFCVEGGIHSQYV